MQDQQIDQMDVLFASSGMPGIPEATGQCLGSIFAEAEQPAFVQPASSPGVVVPALGVSLFSGAGCVGGSGIVAPLATGEAVVSDAAGAGLKTKLGRPKRPVAKECAAYLVDFSTASLFVCW